MTSRRPVSPPYAAVLSAAGFVRRATPGGAAAALDAWDRPAPGGFTIEAHEEEGAGERHLDVGLTPDPGRGALLGPVHRLLSVAALEAALPDLLASLEALASAAESLRCPDCRSGEVLTADADGPYLACGQPGRGRRSFDRVVRRCRRDLVMAMLVVHRDPRAAP